MISTLSCFIPDCTRSYDRAGFCQMHYGEWQQFRSLARSLGHTRYSGLTVLQRLFAKVDVTEACWVWRGATKGSGYGNVGMRVEGRTVCRLAHRFVYEQLVGAIPPTLTLDHLCRNRACVNPDHLEPVTILENIRRAGEFRHYGAVCKYGHPRTPENLYLVKLRGGGQRTRCRPCQKNQVRQGAARRVAARGAAA